MISKSLTLAAAGLVSLSASLIAVPTPYGSPGVINPVTYTFTATGSGDITAYFVGESAGFGSVIGVNVNGVSTGTFGLQNHLSAYGDSLVLGAVSTGDIITFVMRASTAFFGPPPIDYVWYSDPSLNSDGGLNHVFSAPYGGDMSIPAGTYVGFEDLPGGGDLDYDDHEFVFTGPGLSVPDGGLTLSMLAMALSGLFMLRRKL